MPDPPMPPREWLDKFTAPSKGSAGMGWQVGWEAGYIAGLTAASDGRLFLNGGETREEWGVRDEGGYVWAPNASRRDSAEFHAQRMGRQLVRREIREFEDGSSFTGPWVEVTDEG